MFPLLYIHKICTLRFTTQG